MTGGASASPGDNGEVVDDEEEREYEAMTPYFKPNPPHELPTTMTWEGYRFTAKVREPDKSNGGTYHI